MSLGIGLRLTSPPALGRRANNPSIRLSATSVLENAAAGALVGTLSVAHGSGTYAFTLVDDADGLFELDAGDDTRLEVVGPLDYETSTSHQIIVEADNGVDPPLQRTFDIAVVDIDPELLASLSGVTGAWSSDRKLFADYDGPFTTGPDSAITNLHDQVSGVDFQQPFSGGEPTKEFAGPNNRACINFDGVNSLLWQGPAEDVYGVGSKYIAISFMPNAITRNQAEPYANHVILIDEGEYHGLLMRNTGDEYDSLIVYNWDGEEDHVSIPGLEVGKPFVAEFRHEGGNLYGRLNMDTWVSIPSGDTEDLQWTLQLGKGTGNSNRGSLKVFEIVMRNTPGTAAEQDAIAADLMAYVGAVALPSEPVNVEPPTVTGSGGVNSVYTMSDGVWEGPVPSGYVRQWYTWNGSTRTIIGGADQAAIEAPEAAIGLSLVPGLIAVNDFGASEEVFGDPTEVITGEAPVFTAPPTITGDLVVGEPINIVSGTVDGLPAPSSTYQLLNAANDAVLATGQAPVPDFSWEGLSVKPKQTATNSAGSLSSTGSTYGPIEASEDLTGPVLTNLVIDEYAEAYQVTTNEGNGKVWSVLRLQGTTTPSAQQIKDGTDGDAGAVQWHDFIDVSSVETWGDNINIPGDGDYILDVVQQDLAGNFSNILSEEFSVGEEAGGGEVSQAMFAAASPEFLTTDGAGEYRVGAGYFTGEA